MGLPKPLGPLTVAFGDFELRRIKESTEVEVTVHTPPFRVFYPTNCRRPSSVQNLCSRSWLRNMRYTKGALASLIRPTSMIRRFFIWLLAGLFHIIAWPFSGIHARVATPIFPASEENEDARLPVVIFSHGLWASRTTYSALCCDLASHGYIVVAVEHLDGSASMAQYTDHNNQKHWLSYNYGGTSEGVVTLEYRIKQLIQRVQEVQKVVDVLQDLDGGLLTQDFNMVTGSTKLDVSSLLHRLNFKHLGICGHSFGGATSVLVPGADVRFRCCVAMDVWWEPLEKMDVSRSAAKVPILLLNTEKFDWKSLRDARMVFLNSRLAFSTEDKSLVTDMVTIKDTVHENQSDFPLLFTRLSRLVGSCGKLNPFTAKDVNSRQCLHFLQQNMFSSGCGPLHPVNLVQNDKEHLLVGILSTKDD